MKVEGAKPFPHWNEAYKYEIPKEMTLILAYSNGLTGQEVIDHERKTYDVTHWMYAPEPPKSEPKRGVWVSVESDGLPPFDVEVLVANKPSGDLLRARRHPMGWWAHHSASYHESGLDKFTHWYLPHEFKP